PRFPQSEEFALFHREIENLRERFGEPPLGPARTESGLPARAGSAALVATLERMSASERTDAARAAWLAAAEKLSFGEARDRAFGHASDLQLRIALRAELAQALREDANV